MKNGNFFSKHQFSWNFLKIKNFPQILVKHWKVFLIEKEHFWHKLTFIFVKNWNVRQKWKFSSKIEIFVKNGNFHQKWKFSSKMEIFVKNGNFRRKKKFINEKKFFHLEKKIFIKNFDFWQTFIFLFICDVSRYHLSKFV